MKKDLQKRLITVVKVLEKVASDNMYSVDDKIVKIILRKAMKNVSSLLSVLTTGTTALLYKANHEHIKDSVDGINDNIKKLLGMIKPRD